MKNLKSVCKQLLFPPLWLLLVLIPVCTFLLITVFVKSLDESPLAYAVYAASAYTLTAVCIYISRTFPTHYKNAKQKVYNHPIGNRYMTDAAFKVRISLYISLTINLLYSILKLVAGIIYSSLWWGAVAVYYILLSLLRFLLLRYMRRDTGERRILHEHRMYRLCGILMLILNLTLSGIVFQMVWQNKGYSYPGMLIFAVAAYTFYAVTISAIDIIKYRKHKSPILSASKAIRFAAALVSLLSLETAMLVQFGDDEVFRRIMTAATGAGVCLIVLAMSVFMIVRSNRKIKKIGSVKLK